MSLSQSSPRAGRFAQLASPARVSHHERLSPHLALLRLDVDPSYEPSEAGDKIKLQIPGGRPKSYTPARWRPGVLEIVFELHGRGPTAQWAEQARPGAELWTSQALPSLRVPQGRLWFIGDATTLGLALSLHEDARYQLEGVVELPPEDAVAVRRLGLALRVVPPGCSHEQRPQHHDIAVVAGEAGLVARGHAAMGAAGVGQVCSKPYWSRLGKSHRKWVARSTGGAG